MNRWRDVRPHWRLGSAVLAPLLLGRSAVLAAAVSLALLMLVLVGATVALGAAFGRSAARRRACLQTLRILLRLAPWTVRR